MKQIDKNRFLERMKSRYGLVPAHHETFDHFAKRADETINHKDDPKKNMIFKALTQKSRIETNIIDFANKIGREHLRIATPIIDAFRIQVPKEANVKGATYGEMDGSAVLIIDQDEDNTEEIIRTTKNSLEAIIRGESIDIVESEGRGKLWDETNFTSLDPLDILAWNLYQQYLENPAHVTLHELVHAVHINNHKFGRRGNFNKYIKLAVLGSVPIIGPLLKSSKVNFTIETESFAYKVAFDEITEEVVDRVYNNYSFSKFPLSSEELKSELSRRHLKLAKSIIKLAYLGNKDQGYRTPTSNFNSMIFSGGIGMTLLNNGGILSSIAGGFLMYKSINSAIRLPFSIYFSNKIERTLNTLDKLAKAVGDTGDSFFYALGMSPDEIAESLSHSSIPAE